MFNILNDLKSLIKISSVKTEGCIFRCCITFSVLILLTLFVITTTTHFTGGSPTICIQDSKDMQKFADTYCWITTTFTMVKPNRKNLKTDPIGHLKYVYNQKLDSASPMRYHVYYQWVSHVLFIQAILFYAPRWIWKQWENGLLKSLFLPLIHSTSSDTAAIRQEKLRQLSAYMLLTLNGHVWYAIAFFACEILLLADLALQFFFLDLLFNGHFASFGTDLVKYWSSGTTENPIIQLFPNLAKCNLGYYGPGGSETVMDVLCLLPFNVFNAKVFIFFWFWLVIMISLCTAVLCYRVALFFSGRLRFAVLSFRLGGIKDDHFRNVCERCDIGDWVLLNAAAKTLDHFFMQELIVDMSTNMN